MRFQNREIVDTVYVLRNQPTSLLSKAACVSLKIISRVDDITDALGIHADSNKTAAIAHFPAPTNVAELQRFMGMVNQMGKFIPRLAEINKPLRQLLCKDTAWLWEASQETAIHQVKDMLVSSEILAHYDPDRPTVIAADASSEGIGAVLLQSKMMADVVQSAMHPDRSQTPRNAMLS